MTTIYKYQLQFVDEQNIEMPVNAQISTAQTQKGKLQLWCLVNPEKEMSLRQIRIIGTGHPIEKPFTGKYIDTFQLFGGDLVFHVFDNGYKS